MSTALLTYWGQKMSLDSSYSWRNKRSRSSFRLPQSERSLRWIWIAVFVAVAIHVGIIVAAGNIQIMSKIFDDDAEWKDLERVQVGPPEPFDESESALEAESLPEDILPALDETDLLDALPKDTELDIRPDITSPEIAIKMEIPAISGEEESLLLEPVAGPQFEVDVPDTGNLESELLDSQTGRLVVDPGEASADVFDPDEVTRDLARKGLDTLSSEGVPEGYTSIDSLLKLPGNALGAQKGMIGSDLLFEFNQATLRESARFSLMKVALLIDKNPKMYCLLEGHADLIGGAEYNFELSAKRAQAVKDWLVAALKLDADKIIVIGMGQQSPLVKTGDEKAQAINRRVEIKMRNTPPENIPVRVKPQRVIENLEQIEQVVPVPPQAEPVIPKAQPVIE